MTLGWQAKQVAQQKVDQSQQQPVSPVGDWSRPGIIALIPGWPSWPLGHSLEGSCVFLAVR